MRFVRCGGGHSEGAWHLICRSRHRSSHRSRSRRRSPSRDRHKRRRSPSEDSEELGGYIPRKRQASPGEGGVLFPVCARANGTPRSRC